MSNRRFEFVQGSSAKFWEISQRGANVVTTYGRIGGKGASTTKSEASPVAAKALAAKLIAEKTKKGYVEAKADVKADAKAAAKAAPTKPTKTAGAKGKAPKAPAKTTVLAAGPDYKFAQKILTFGDAYVQQIGDVVEIYDTKFKGTVVAVKGTVITVRNAKGKEAQSDSATAYISVESSPTITAAWDGFLRNDKPDGVAYSDKFVPPALQASLQKNFDKLAKAEPVDYHPGSGTKVRDLVHPSLYPYVNGKSKFVGAAPANAGKPPKYDRWGRKYEGSVYQWLPSQFYVGNNGDVEIRSYINNLPAGYQALQNDLGKLFTCALPLLESVLGYVQTMKFFVEDDANVEHEGELPEGGKPKPAKIPPRKLRNRELQVVPKIVEYQLQANETHEGVWHVEGMSHEHIIATCVYVLDRDDALQGGDIEFKRACTVEEAGMMFWGADQLRPAPAQALIEDAQIPLGHVATPKGRLFVFPNSHIHKLSKLFSDNGKVTRRRVIVFWVVDPDVTIVSTRDIAPQQTSMKHAEALRIRLKLMEERKRHKGNFNVRSISLCEH